MAGSPPSRSRSPPPVWDAWRDDPDAPWVEVLVRYSDLDEATGDFREFDEATWSRLGEDARYRYRRRRGASGEDRLSFRALPDPSHTVEHLKRFVALTLRGVFGVSVRRDHFMIRTESGAHVPRNLRVLQELRPNSTVYFAAI